MPRGFRIRAAALVLGAAALLAACQAEVAKPASSVVTFQVADGSQFKVLLTDAADLKVVAELAEGKDAPSIPNGRLVDETGVNTGWSWSIDPADFDFVDITDGSCDGTPQEIEDGTLESDRFCPWSAMVVSLQPAE